MTDLPHSFHIHLRGRVQGVGFRPWVYRLARERGLKGTVRNTTDGVHIDLDAPEDEARAFLAGLLRDKPPLSVITQSEFYPTAKQRFESFSIVESDSGAEPSVLLSPDFAFCSDCRADFFDAENRRSGYAFTTCTNCGPRYSIMTGLPYDRPQTTMRDFEMCPACRAEYENPLDRRYFSQTNSCAVCGIRLSIFPENPPENGLSPAETAVKILLEGKILALKGIGGYLLLCDAANEQAVRTLRARKHRPGKPFAVLYADGAMLEGDVMLNETALHWLNGPVSPIVLMRLKPEPKSRLAVEALAPGLDHIGVMMPYAPLLQLIASRVGRPLVATSGNLSHAPIVFRDENARSELSGVADFILSHNRDIVLPQDDSVLRLSERHNLPVWLRRSRGLAPSLLIPGLDAPRDCVFCAGADMKSAFAYTQSGNVYLSQYLGDLESFDTQENYRLVVEHVTGLFREKPAAVLCDAHPLYFSRQLAQNLAETWNAPLIPVQHHKAHFAAVLGEHGLIDSEEPVLGVIWDGTGYGDDGQIWGGEWFLWQNRQMERYAHWSYFPYLAGEKMAREPRIAALAACPDAEFTRPLFSEKEWNLYQILLKTGQKISTSSVGRLFDAAAAILGIATHNRYEGEAALLLETIAERDAAPFEQSFFMPDSPAVDTGAFLSAIAARRRAGENAALISGRMHRTLVEIIRATALRAGLRKLAFSGGVFQNALLLDLLQEHLSADFTLYFHRQLPSNDENIAFGQLMAFQHKIL